MNLEELTRRKLCKICLDPKNDLLIVKEGIEFSLEGACKLSPIWGSHRVQGFNLLRTIDYNCLGFGTYYPQIIALRHSFRTNSHEEWALGCLKVLENQGLSLEKGKRHEIYEKLRGYQANVSILLVSGLDFPLISVLRCHPSGRIQVFRENSSSLVYVGGGSSRVVWDLEAESLCKWPETYRRLFERVHSTIAIEAFYMFLPFTGKPEFEDFHLYLANETREILSKNLKKSDFNGEKILKKKKQIISPNQNLQKKCRKIYQQINF